MLSLMKIIIFTIGIFAVTHEANARCRFKPPFKCKYTSLPTLVYKIKLPPLPKPSALPPCPKPATKVTNKADVNIPLPLPNEIPLGKFCTCQKFAIKPTLVPCLPASAPIGANPVAAAIPWSAVPPSVLNPDILRAILAGGIAPAAAAPCVCP